MDGTADITALLDEHGISPTRQRLAIAGMMLREPCHLTAEQVLQRLRADDVHVSKATVYNTLGLFARRGLLREVVVERGRVFYDSTASPHHHFYEPASGRLSDIPRDAVELASLPPPPEGMQIEGVEVVIRLRSRRRPGR